MYYEGMGTPPNFEEAAKWYRLAAEQGDPGAQFSLAVMLILGDGIKKNKKEAVNWIIEAANQNEPRAQFALGVLLFFGDGIKENRLLAMEWLQKSASQGLPDAIDFLFELKNNRNLKYLKKLYQLK
jgi:TPR repeat protein